MVNKRAFTLIELLAVIVILSIILTISIPTIIATIENIKRDSFASATKMMLASAKVKISEDKDIIMPANNYEATILTLSYLRLENMVKDIDSGLYNKDNSYVLIVNYNDELVNYVTVQGSRRSIDLIKEGVIAEDKVFPSTEVTVPRALNNTYTSTELGEVGSFSVTVKYSY